MNYNARKELVVLANILRKVREAQWGLHPLIHTIAPETSAQDVEKKKAELKTQHFLSLNQDIVAGSQEEKCGLKYVIYTPRV